MMAARDVFVVDADFPGMATRNWAVNGINSQMGAIRVRGRDAAVHDPENI